MKELGAVRVEGEGEVVEVEEERAEELIAKSAGIVLTNLFWRVKCLFEHDLEVSLGDLFTSFICHECNCV